MVLNFEAATTTPATTTPDVEAFLQQFLASVGLRFPGRPTGEVPTLVGAPTTLSTFDADRLHSEASRWLEYIEGVLAKVESRHLVQRQMVESERRRLLHVYKKDWVGKCTDEELDKLSALEQTEVELHAMVTTVQSVQRSVSKVANKASRTITVHTKTNPAGF